MKRGKVPKAEGALSLLVEHRKAPLSPAVSFRRSAGQANAAIRRCRSIHNYARSHVVNPTEPVPPDDDPADPAPQRPREPDAADCCGEGCVRCVYDVYEDKLERYQRVLAAWRTRHPPS